MFTKIYENFTEYLFLHSNYMYTILYSNYTTNNITFVIFAVYQLQLWSTHSIYNSKQLILLKKIMVKQCYEINHYNK